MPRMIGFIVGLVIGCIINVAFIIPNLKTGDGRHTVAAITGMFCGIWGGGIGVAIGGFFSKKD